MVWHCTAWYGTALHCMALHCSGHPNHGHSGLTLWNPTFCSSVNFSFVCNDDARAIEAGSERHLSIHRVPEESSRPPLASAEKYTGTCGTPSSSACLSHLLAGGESQKGSGRKRVTLRTKRDRTCLQEINHIEEGQERFLSARAPGCTLTQPIHTMLYASMLGLRTVPVGLYK